LLRLPAPPRAADGPRTGGSVVGFRWAVAAVSMGTPLCAMPEVRMSSDMFTDAFETSQAAVAARLEQILEAATVKDLDRLAGYHLAGPKFTKFDDVEPLGRQDAETAMRSEAEQFAAIDDFHGRFGDLKIDVFGPVAIATAVLVWDARTEGESVSGRTRTTLVFVERGGEWLIAHEHLSPFVASP
jgi:ketosteroid isomerase-like protein